MKVVFFLIHAHSHSIKMSYKTKQSTKDLTQKRSPKLNPCQDYNYISSMSKHYTGMLSKIFFIILETFFALGL